MSLNIYEQSQLDEALADLAKSKELIAEIWDELGKIAADNPLPIEAFPPLEIDWQKTEWEEIQRQVYERERRKNSAELADPARTIAYLKKSNLLLRQHIDADRQLAEAQSRADYWKGKESERYKEKAGQKLGFWLGILAGIFISLMIWPAD